MSEQFASVANITAQLSGVRALKATLTAVKRFSYRLEFGEQVILANTVFTFLGSIADLMSFPQNPHNGDAYYVSSEQTYYAFMGERWMDIGAATMCEQLTAAQKAYLKSMVGV